MVSTFVTNTYYDTKSTKLIFSTVKSDTLDRKIFCIKNPRFIYHVSSGNKNARLKRMKLADVKEVICNYGELYESLAKSLGLTEQDYNNLKYSGQLRKLNESPDAHGSDVSIEDFYKEQIHAKANIADAVKPNILFVDIENRATLGKPDPFTALEPIVLISFEFKGILYTLVSSENFDEIKEIKELENDVDLVRTNLIAKIKDRYKDKGISDYRMIFYDKEQECIAAFFDFVNNHDVDIVAAWNAQYDIITMVNRLARTLGIEPPPIKNKNNAYQAYNDKKLAQLILSKDVLKHNVHSLYFNIRQSPEIADNEVSIKIPGKTAYLDQLYTYAANTRGSKRSSYKLDDVAFDELGENKMHTEFTMREFMYKDFMTFVEYNPHDTMLCKGMEKSTYQIQNTFLDACISNTRIEHVHRKTKSHKMWNRKFYKKRGYVLSNKRNAMKRSMVKGAYVNDPRTLGRIGIQLINSRSNRIFDSVIDKDFSSQYPNVIIAYNIDFDTLEGKIVLFRTITVKSNVKVTEIPELQQNEILDEALFDIFEKIEGNITDDDEEVINSTQENDINSKLKDVDIKVNIGTAFTEKLISDNVVDLCHDFLNLPDLEEMIELI